MMPRPAFPPRRPSLLALPALAAALACGAEPADGRAPDGPPGRATEATAAVSVDPAVQRAREALREGRPYLATTLLAPALADAARRTPEVELLAASAAAEWGGWRTVERLLADARWLDTRFAGAGRALLARAALARNADSLAAEHARRAAEQADRDEDRGVRLGLLARALDRLERRDEAADAYARSATLLPTVSSWLWLRAAAVTDDSAARAARLARVELSTARARAAVVDAEARERAGDFAGAARAFAALGDSGDALRLRVADAKARGDSAALAAVRRELLAVVERDPGSAQARVAAATLDSALAPLGAREQLLAARVFARSGPAAQAASLYARALAAGQGTADDRLRHARLLAALGRYDDAVREFARVPSSHPNADAAAYEGARARLRAGNAAAARTALREVLRRHPGTDGAARALFLLADMATDEGRDEAARAAFREMAAKHPRHSLAPRARFAAAMVAYVDGRHASAAAELDTLRERYPQSGEANAATYWSGRAWAAAGRRARAQERWREVMRRAPLSYYALLAAARLDTTPWTPRAAADSLARLPEVEETLARAALLEELGMDPEARREYDAVPRLAGDDPGRLLAAAAALQRRGRSARGITLASRARAQGAAEDARLYRRLYPVVHGDVLAAEARERRIDPALVAALIRQESSFEPRATSPAGARGLMQLMPNVGTAIARGMRLPEWDPALLWEPDVNLRLGTAHLATLLGQYDRLEHVLAAYNAGGSRVRRWREKRGAADPEVFTERIPYAETRDYVRIVLRNRDLYRALYGWSTPEVQQSGR